MLAFLFEAQKFTSRHPTNLPPLERCWHPKLQNAASSRTRSTAGAYGATAFKASKPRGTEFCFSKISFTFKASLVKSEQFRKEFQLLKFWFWEQQHISYNHIIIYIYIYFYIHRRGTRCVCSILFTWNKFSQALPNCPFFPPRSHPTPWVFGLPNSGRKLQNL